MPDFKLAPAENSLIKLKYCTLLKVMLLVLVVVIVVIPVVFSIVAVIVVVVKHCCEANIKHKL